MQLGGCNINFYIPINTIHYMRGLLFFLIIAWLAWWGGASYWYSCIYKGHCNNKAAKVETKKVEPEEKVAPKVTETPKIAEPIKNPIPWNVSGHSFKNKSTDNILFSPASDKPEVPNSVLNTLPELKQYLTNNKTKALELVGYYKSNEAKPAGFDNMGLARAENTKKIFVSRGINADQITTRAQVKNNETMFNNKVTGSIYGRLINNPTPPVAEPEKKPEEEKTGLLKQAVDLNKATAANFKKGERIELKNVQFDSGSARLRKTSATDLDKLVKILTDNKNIKIEIGGHTDATGSLTLNNTLSGNRARSVMQYLIKNGIAAARLSSKGYGPSQAIADNTTAEGRQKNRRVEIKIN